MLGVDIASNLVAAGNKRAKELGLANCRFQESDAANLHQVPEQISFARDTFTFKLPQPPPQRSWMNSENITGRP